MRSGLHNIKENMCQAIAFGQKAQHNLHDRICGGRCPEAKQQQQQQQQ